MVVSRATRGSIYCHKNTSTCRLEESLTQCCWNVDSTPCARCLEINDWTRAFLSSDPLFGYCGDLQASRWTCWHLQNSFGRGRGRSFWVTKPKQKSAFVLRSFVLSHSFDSILNKKLNQFCIFCKFSTMVETAESGPVGILTWWTLWAESSPCSFGSQPKS